MKTGLTLGFNRLFRTGDYVRISTKNGKRVLFYEGRSDSQVKVRGQRVDLMEIESVLNSQTDLIGRAVVLCYKAGQENQVISVSATGEVEGTILSNPNPIFSLGIGSIYYSSNEGSE